MTDPRDEALEKVLDRLRETDSHGYVPITGDERDGLIELLEASLSATAPSTRTVAECPECGVRFDPTWKVQEMSALDVMRLYPHERIPALAAAPSPDGNEEPK